MFERRSSFGGKIREDCTIYMVLEYGEIDFAGMLVEKRKTMADRTQILDENWLRLYWQVGGSHESFSHKNRSS